MPPHRIETVNFRRRRLLAATALFAATAIAGCAAPARRGEIPCGLWAGKGAFVYETWKAPAATQPGETGEPRPTSVHRKYDTTLSIRPVVLDGQDAIEIEIVSDRGPLPDLGDRTHLKMALLHGKRISESTVLYRLADWQFNPEHDAVLNLRGDRPPRAAACTTRGDRTVLAIQYDENFVDIFRFQSNIVEKSGMFYSKDDGFIHWTERLRRRD
ncbi:MAG: hypothetical protein HUU22_01230 [Phycisphaerae bacterium]|nr:hypothetical protein [Phycisphaerae bacterium]NUQ44638.1 hypothetical protein [Phycisphaerae bacterium]